jgi:hypothetical protein
MQSRKTLLTVALLALGSTAPRPAAAQSTVQTNMVQTNMLQTREVFTNRAITALGAAGFSEDFLIDLIRNSKTGFDTSVDGLAALARQGISEPVIRAMLSSPVAAAPKTPADVTQFTANSTASSTSAASPRVRPTPTPCDVSFSFLWGFYTKHVGRGVSQAGQDPLAPPGGTIYGAALSTGAFVPIAH